MAYYTYSVKKEGSFRVVIKGIHHSTDLNDLKEEIEAKGHEVLNIYNMNHRFTKKPLPILFVDLEQGQNYKEIYSLQTLHSNVVHIETLQQKREIG